MAENILNTSKLFAGYGKKIIVGDVNITLERGKIITLLGPNGAGKSTVLKTICSKLKPVSGSVTILGENLQNIKSGDIAKRISAMLTKQISTELMTAGDVVAAGRYPYTGTLGILSQNDINACKSAMELCDILNLKDLDFNSLSDGQKQRVLLARAVCQEPDVLVLDEPTSFLDIKYKAQLCKIILKLAKIKNISVILSLHETEIASKISDIVVCIKNGKAMIQGSPEKILTDENICKLYDLEGVRYSANLGTFSSFDIDENASLPKVFVIGSGRGTLNIYKKLSRENISFVCGILHENELAYEGAKIFSKYIITEKPYENLSNEAYNLALEKLRLCEKVILTENIFTAYNMKNKDLFKEAERLGLECIKV